MVRADLSRASPFARHRRSSAPGRWRPPPPRVGEAVALPPGASPARGAALGCGGGRQAWHGRAWCRRAPARAALAAMTPSATSSLVCASPSLFYLLYLFSSFSSSSSLVTGLPLLVEMPVMLMHCCCSARAAVLLLRRLGCCASRCANPTAVLLLLLCCSCCSCYCLYWPWLLLPWPCQCLLFLLDSCSVLLFMLLCLPVTHVCSCMLPWLTAVSDSCYFASTRVLLGW